MKYFDLPCDTISECHDRRVGLRHNDLHWSLERAGIFQPAAQVFAIFVHDRFRKEAAADRFDALYGTFVEQMKENAGAIAFCRTGGELQTAFQDGKAAAVLSIEGGGALGGQIENLRKAYDKGVRILTLTWNGRCELGDGVGATDPDAGGLTLFGLDVVREMERLGMVVDVSHLSQAGFRDVAAHSTRPFIASHSNSKAVCAHRRNLTDRQFAEIVRRGGLVGINLCRNFLTEDGNAAMMTDILRHVEHFLSLGGEEVLAVGGDLDGSTLPDGFSGVQDLARMYEELLRHFPQKTVDGIFFNNAARFFTHTLA